MKLGFAVQLCTLPWLGFVPDEVGSAPPVAVARLADRLGLDPEVLEGYGRRSHTRSDHLLLAARYLGWKSAPAGGAEMKELERFLLDRAMEHDSPTLLFNLATELLMSVKTIRPGVSILERMIISARTGATALTSEPVGHLLTGQRCSDLDRLLAVDAGLGMTRLAWLTRPAAEATASAVLTSVGKLTYLRNLDAHTVDLSMLPAKRRRFLATVGRRSTVQALMRREERRYPILLALVAQSAVDQLDEVIALFDQAVSARESRVRTRTGEELAKRARKGESRQLLMDVILPVLADPSIPDDQVGGLLRERIGMSVLRHVAAGAWKPLAKDHGRLSALDSSYSYLRQFTPGVLAAVDFTGGPGTAELMAAVAILTNLNASGGRKVPAGAPASFVPARYADYLEKARKAGDDTGFRHYWELCVILGLRDGPRSGDIFVPGSRRYADPATYLYTPGQWMPRQGEYCRLVGKPARAADAIAQGKEELHAALAELESTLAGALPDDTGTARLDHGGLREDLLRHRVGEADRSAEAHVVPGISAGRGHAGGVAAGPAGPAASASGGDRQRAGRSGWRSRRCTRGSTPPPAPAVWSSISSPAGHQAGSAAVTEGDNSRGAMAVRGARIDRIGACEVLRWRMRLSGRLTGSVPLWFPA